MQEWRFIDSSAADAYRNMAIDEALLKSFVSGVSNPVLRVYSWSPAAVSIGRHQKVEQVLDTEGCRRDHLSIVRRMTGGGLIFHSCELTYSLICSQNQFSPSDSLKDNYKNISKFLILMYNKLNLKAEYAVFSDIQDSERLGKFSEVCYAGKEEYDIVVRGKKIGGNAQRVLRNRGLVFQHGSIPLRLDTAQIKPYLKTDSDTLPHNATSLSDVGVMVSLDSLKELLYESFMEHSGQLLKRTSLTQEEIEFSERLICEKYGTDKWNLAGIEGEQ